MTGKLPFANVDFHCHLDLFPDHASAIASAEQARVMTLSVTTTPKAWPRNVELTQGCRFVVPALGLHPQLVSERASEISEWETYLPEARFVGEVGLDAGPKFSDSLEIQKRVFRTVLQRCAMLGGKVLSVHSIRSSAAVLDMIEAYLPSSRGTAVLHWFTGTPADVRKASSLGCLYSINAQMAQSEKGRRVILEAPLERLLTETDGPFTVVAGRPAQPADVRLAVQAIATVRQISEEAVAEAVQANVSRLLGRPMDGFR